MTVTMNVSIVNEIIKDFINIDERTLLNQVIQNQRFQFLKKYQMLLKRNRKIFLRCFKRLIFHVALFLKWLSLRCLCLGHLLQLGEFFSIWSAERC
jgi:hypothetical protein